MIHNTLSISASRSARASIFATAALCASSSLDAATYTNNDVKTTTLVENGTSDSAKTYNILNGYSFGDTSTNLYIGDNTDTYTSSSYVDLSISNGGSILGAYIYIGYGSTSYGSYGYHNSVTLVGSSSYISATQVYVGYYGSGNTLTVQNGADVTLSGSMYIGAGYGSAATYSTNSDQCYGYGNSVTVTGSGSTLSTGSGYAIFLGQKGCGNSLSIANDAVVTCGTLNIGNGSTSYGSGQTGSYNTATVGGTSSGDSASLTMTDYLKVGSYGSHNSFTLQNGAKASAGMVVIGYGEYSKSTNAENGFGYKNSLTVTGADSILTVYSSSSSVYTDIQLGGNGCSNSISVSSGGSIVCGALNVGNGAEGYGQSGSYNTVTIGGETSGDTASLTINGYSSYTYALEIGANGSGNSLLVQNGADVSCLGLGMIGYGVADAYYTSSNATDGYGYGYNNSITVTGAGSTLSFMNSSNVYQALQVGYYGCGNKLNVTNGGSVSCGAVTLGVGSIDYGSGAAGSYNSVTVSGKSGSSVSTLAIDGNLEVGVAGSNNSVTVSAGGKLTCITIYLSSSSSIATSNSVTVTGSGSLLADSGNLTIGYSYNSASNSGNTLTIDDGAMVQVGGTISITSGNYIYLGDGYLAVAGNYTSGGSLNGNLATLLSGIHLYNSSTSSYSTTATTSNTYLVYITSDMAAAYQATLGYSNLTGYTIFSTSLITVPEPSTYALFGGFAVLGLAIVRRKQGVSKNSRYA